MRSRNSVVFGLTVSLAAGSLYACSDNTNDVQEPVPAVDASPGEDAKSNTFGDTFVPDARTTQDSSMPSEDSGPATDSGLDASKDAATDASDSGVVLPVGIGDFSVVRIGMTGGTLTSAAAPVFIEERSLTDGTVVKTTNLPTAAAGANFPITLRGSAMTAEGTLALSANSAYLVLGGYSSTPGTAAPADDTAATAPRVVARVDKDGNVDTSTVLTGAYNAGAARSVASADGTAFWIGGSTANTEMSGGAWYATLGTTTPTQLFNTVVNLRAIGLFGGQVYGTTQSSTDYHVFSLGTGMPTDPNQTATALPGYGVTFEPGSAVLLDTDGADGVDTMYVTETEAVATKGGGVQKWTFAAGTWTLKTTFTNGLGTSGPLFVNAKQVGTDIVVIATTAEAAARVIRWVDDGVNLTPTGVTLATGTSGVTSFRGIAFPAK